MVDDKHELSIESHPKQGRKDTDMVKDSGADVQVEIRTW